MAVESVIEDPRWADLDIETLARRAASEALAQLGLDPEAWDISLLACSDARIADLNAEFRGMVQATNVLSWPSAERAPDTPGAVPVPPDPTDPELGDIALAYETCARSTPMPLIFWSMGCCIYWAMTTRTMPMRPEWKLWRLKYLQDWGSRTHTSAAACLRSVIWKDGWATLKTDRLARRRARRKT
jgi:ssRNA-specific RNase YbeY (16S rRNA maturation enzyme)